MHKISRNHIHKRSNKAVKQLCESHPLIEIEWGKYTSNYLVACHSFTFSFLKFGRKNSFVLLPVVCLGIKKQCIKSFFVDNDEDDKMKSWIRSNLIDDHDFYPNGQVLGIRKAAVVAGVWGGLMLDWSATEYNYPPSPRVFILLLLSHRLHWNDCTSIIWRYLAVHTAVQGGISQTLSEVAGCCTTCTTAGVLSHGGISDSQLENWGGGAVAAKYWTSFSSAESYSLISAKPLSHLCSALCVRFPFLFRLKHLLSFVFGPSSLQWLFRWENFLHDNEERGVGPMLILGKKRC